MCIVIRTKQETVKKCGSLYEAVRWCWKADINRAMKACYVLAVVNYGTGVFKVEEVFKPQKWHCITKEECQNKTMPICNCSIQPCGRIGFTDKKDEKADAETRKRYIGKIIQMSQNPIKYIEER
jgi:hypothetical protein